ncbi:MAG: GTP 3',8-cyclase MoaA [Clostridiales bacterium]|nr:GTP 3',8-cyclase MoaA [Clostridiales bacterium]
MKDSVNREINYMRISVTDRCNLRCVYCMPHGTPTLPMEEILTFEEIERVCRQAVTLGITRFKITGGEPLVRLGCPALVHMIRRIPGVQQVTMTTNGVLLEKYLDELTAAGLGAVNISLDTTNRELYQKITGTDCLDRVMASIEAAAKSGIPVKINAVLQPNLNADAWVDLLALAKQYGIDLRFIELMPVGQGKFGTPVSNADLFHRIETTFGPLKPDERPHGNGPATYYRLSSFDGSIGFISPIHGNFCGSCNRIRMTSTGEIKPCLICGDTFDVRTALRSNGTDHSKQNPDEDVRRILAAAISAKPPRHRFGTAAVSTEMSKIGG